MGQKSVSITGCSEGRIGDPLARKLNKKGLRVFATARNLTKIQHLKELDPEILPLDNTDDFSIEQAVESVRAATWGVLDILVNNSGGGCYGEEDVRREPVCLVAVAQAFASILIASESTIVNIGSIVGKFPLPWQGYYNASNAAVNLLSDQLRIEISPFNVKVVNVVTGSVLTRFMENLAKSPRLPPNSQYSPAKQEVEDTMTGKLAFKNVMNVEAYAEEVAKNAVKSSSKNIQWLGDDVFLIWLAGAFGWAIIWAYPVSVFT